MRKITSLLSFACAFLFSATAIAQVTALTDKVVKSVSETPVTALTTGKWYVMENDLRGDSYAYDTGTNLKRAAANTHIAVGMATSECAKALFTLTDAKTAVTVNEVQVTGYTMQWGTGNYTMWPKDHDAPIATGSDVPTEANIYTAPLTYDGATWFQFAKNTNKDFAKNTDEITAGENVLIDNQGENGNVVCWSDDNTTFRSSATGRGNSIWKVYEVELADLSEQVTFTYSYKVDGVEKLTEAVTIMPGADFPAPTTLPAYVNYTLPTGKVSSSDAGTVKDVVCTYNLPFIASESYTNAKWYLVDMHSNDNGAVDILSGEKSYIWTYDDTQLYNVYLPKRVIKQATGLFGGDASLWCFVGNPFDGFEIYNKAAGSSMKLYRELDNKALSDGCTAQMSADNATKFKLVPSTAITGATCFLPVGHNYYLNTQALGGIKYLSGWSATDGGSSCRFFTPTHFVKSYVDALVLMPTESYCVNAPANMTAAELATLNSVKTALDADEWNTSVITSDVETLLAKLKSNTVPFNENGYYFLKSKSHQNKANAHMQYRKNSDGYGCYANQLGDAKPTIDYIWKFVKSGDGYKLNACNLDKYLTLVAAAAVSTVNADFDGGDKFILEDKGGAEFLISKNAKGSNMVIRTEGGGQVNYWNANDPNGISSTWYIIPAEELDITVTAAGYSTTYLPFDVTVPSELEAYALTATSTTSATLEKKTSIPAKKGAILKGAQGKYTLNIASAEAWESSKLEGTCVDTYVEGNAYVLSKPAGQEVGLYKAKLNKDADGSDNESGTHFLNNANKAYLPASALDGVAPARFLFDFGTETGIEDINGAENEAVNAVVYDLSGRRVQSAQKGIYIVNGKKVIK